MTSFYSRNFRGSSAVIDTELLPVSPKVRQVLHVLMKRDPPPPSQPSLNALSIADNDLSSASALNQYLSTCGVG